MLFSFYLIISVGPIDFGSTDELKRQCIAFSFLFNGLIRSLDYFRLFQPRPVLHGSAKMLAQYRASAGCFGCAQPRQLAEFEMGTVPP
jgi:hypothetical protein